MIEIRFQKTVKYLMCNTNKVLKTQWYISVMLTAIQQYDIAQWRKSRMPRKTDGKTTRVCPSGLKIKSTERNAEIKTIFKIYFACSYRTSKNLRFDCALSPVYRGWNCAPCVCLSTIRGLAVHNFSITSLCAIWGEVSMKIGRRLHNINIVACANRQL